MALHLHKRGKFWHVQGSVSWGNKTVSVRRSTDRTLKREAEQVVDEFYQQAINTLKNGSDNAAIPFSIAAINWVKAKKRKPTCRQNIKQLGNFFQDYILGDITDEAWRKYVNQQHADSRPAAINRIRTTLVSVLRHASVNYTIAKEKEPDKRIVFLSIEKQNELLAAYPEFARPYFQALCYQGLRKSEACQLLWNDVNFHDDIILIRGENNHTGSSRFIPLHTKVKATLQTMERRSNLYVFTNRYSSPYSLGGPRKVHETARKKVGLPSFTIHDWRHHWASRLAMLGTNSATLMELGGWETPDMVHRYASLSNEHKKNTINKL